MICLDHSNSWARRRGSRLRWNSISSTSRFNWSTSCLSISVFNGKVRTFFYLFLLSFGLVFSDETLGDFRTASLRGSLIWLKRRLRKYLDGFRCLTGQSSKRTAINHSLPQAWLSRLFRLNFFHLTFWVNHNNLILPWDLIDSTMLCFRWCMERTTLP